MIGPTMPVMSLDTLLARLAADAGVPLVELTGPCRAAPLSRLRFAFAWVARGTFGASWAMIGRALGGRVRQTAMNAHRRGVKLRDRDPAFRALTDRFATSMGADR